MPGRKKRQVDLLTGAVLSALASDAREGAGKAGDDEIATIYADLKDELKKKLRYDSVLLRVVESLEAAPGSTEHWQMLEQEIAASEADQDPDVQRIAAKLLRRQVEKAQEAETLRADVGPRHEDLFCSLPGDPTTHFPGDVTVHLPSGKPPKRKRRPEPKQTSPGERGARDKGRSS